MVNQSEVYVNAEDVGFTQDDCVIVGASLPKKGFETAVSFLEHL